MLQLHPISTATPARHAPRGSPMTSTSSGWGCFPSLFTPLLAQLSLAPALTWLPEPGQPSSWPYCHLSVALLSLKGLWI